MMKDKMTRLRQSIFEYLDAELECDRALLRIAETLKELEIQDVVDLVEKYLKERERKTNNIKEKINNFSNLTEMLTGNLFGTLKSDVYIA